MKKMFSCALALMMLLSLVTVPTLAERGVSAEDAADLNEALNVPGGTLRFNTDDLYPWVVSGDAAKSTNSGVSNSTSSVYTTVIANEGELLNFDFLSCGEGSDSDAWDGLRLFIDGVEAAKWGKHTEWMNYSHELTAGSHNIAFTFKKDGSVNVGEDCAYLDNVQVIAPTMAEQIVASDLSVPAGRRAEIEYEVLPEETFNKNVTFTSSDAAVASVNESGVVTGISEGTAIITITSAAVPGVSADVAVNVTEALPTAELFGFATYDFGVDQSNDMKWVSFTDAMPETLTAYNTMPNNVSAAAYYDGSVYGYYFDGTDQNPIRNFFVMDHEAHALTFTGDNWSDGVFAMAYDYTRGNMYAVCGENETRNLGIVNLETGAIAYVGELSVPMIMTLAIDGEGVGYGLTMNQSGAELYRIDLDTAECTLVGATGVPLAYLQSMTYDYTTGKLFWAQVINTGTGHGLYCIDTDTAEVEYMGVIGDGTELTGLYSTAVPDQGGLLGDADLNGSVAVADAVLALRHAMGLTTLTGAALTQADVNLDGSVTVIDAALILRYALGLINNF